jgi:sec-independent protein translocase protein TatB
MLNFGFGEIVLIMVLAIVVVGPERLPEMLRFLGKQYGKVMRASNDLRRAFMLEADRADAEKRAALLRERREQARQRAQEAREKALEAARARAAAAAEGGDDAGTPDLEAAKAAREKAREAARARAEAASAGTPVGGGDDVPSPAEPDTPDDGAGA